jgi:16S rRNA (guanine966-N2)-methyltransferase
MCAVRIIAGSRKGHRIQAPRGTDTRPTGDRVREAAFNLIGPVDGADVLDLFAGSGAMGLEALSRGAARVTFVEADRGACRAIDANLEKLRLTGSRVIHQDAGRLLALEAQAGRRYDLVLVDPPYAGLEAALPALDRHLPSLLGEDALVVVESASRDEPELPSLEKRTSRRYGSARLTLFEPRRSREVARGAGPEETA